MRVDWESEMGSVYVWEREGRRAPGFIPALHYASKGYHGNQLIRPLSATTRRSITSIFSLSHCFHSLSHRRCLFHPSPTLLSTPYSHSFLWTIPHPLYCHRSWQSTLSLTLAPQRVNRARHHSSGRQFRLHIGEICPVSWPLHSPCRTLFTSFTFTFQLLLYLICGMMDGVVNVPKEKDGTTKWNI